MKDLYDFVYRGVLTDESLDKAGRRKSAIYDSVEAENIRRSLSYDMLENDLLVDARRMATVYIAIHAFENMVRDFVKTTLTDNYEEEWWEKVPTKIQTKAKKRIEDEAKFRWHGARGGSDIEYCDFGDLSSMIVTNWDIFEDILVDMEWTKSILNVLERSRNIAMHGGVLASQDMERIGNNIRDWVRQVG